MSTSAATAALGVLFPAKTPRFFLSFPPSVNGPAEVFTGIRPSGKWLNFTFRLQCSTVSNLPTGEYKDINVAQNGMPVLKWPEIVQETTAAEEGPTEQGILKTWNKIKKRIEAVRAMLRSMEDGEISISAYDTAWVALVEDLDGSGAPHFPSALEWISNNQLADGSWGDSHIFLVHDRIINTLACVVALKSCHMHPEKREKGLEFVRDNIDKLGDENAEHMPIGFEVAFPSLIHLARKLNLDIPADSHPVLQEIYEKRDLKLRRIPKEILQTVPTTLLHSLEGMQGLNWEKLLELKSSDGSFLFSPSSTAFAVMETKDRDCLAYLTKIVQKFNGGVPNVYPVDMFEHIWAVDRLQRLGISRYFRTEIKECVDYVHRYWTEKGICWARNTQVHDIDDTAMGFRILRLHGYEVSPEVFRHFEKRGEFFCFAGQSNQAVTGMYNLLRASEIMFPGEEILAQAKKFSSEFLQEKRANNELLDKWIITKDLPGEVNYALDLPWYASLPRVETRLYLEQYGGQDDVWIGKTLYRMSNVNNNEYLELGKLDYNNCQAMHQLEWKSFQKWYAGCGLWELGLSEKYLLLAYYLATASIFEPERSKERLAWAKTAALIETIKSNFGNEASMKQKAAFIEEFERNSVLPYYVNIDGRNDLIEKLVSILLGTINQFYADVIVLHGRDIYSHLYEAWTKWLQTWQDGGDMSQGEAELIVRTLNLCSGAVGKHASEDKLLSHPKYQNLMNLLNKICHQIRQLQHMRLSMTGAAIDSDMQELVKLVLSDGPEDLDAEIKQSFLLVAKSFYYAAHCNPGTINFHIAKVLFERVH